MTKLHTIADAVLATTAAMLLAAGCAVTRDQETIASYFGDAAITSNIKGRFIDNQEVDASSIGIETLHGTVQLSGFAKNATEKSTAEAIARQVKGVVSVRNDIVVRP
jgi:hyperosmotically inducible periplasmic protein